MSTINGTNVAAAVRPFDTADTFPVAYANELLGGHHSYDTKAKLYAIPKARRVVGMTCFVEEDHKNYRLINNPTTDTTADTDWEVVAETANDMKLANGNTIAQQFISIQNDLQKRYVVFVLSPANETGPSDIEITLPFKCKVTGMSLNASAGLELTSPIEVKVESYSGAWSDIDSVVLSTQSTSNTANKYLTVPVSLDIDARLRCSIVQTFDEVTKLQVTVFVEKTDI